MVPHDSPWLNHHGFSGSSCLPTCAPQVPPDSLFRGLRVRMSLATGSADAIRFHTITQRAEYVGDVLKRVQAVSEAPHGGQVIMDPQTFKGIHARLPELGGCVIAATQNVLADAQARHAANGHGSWPGTGGPVQSEPSATMGGPRGLSLAHMDSLPSPLGAKRPSRESWLALSPSLARSSLFGLGRSWGAANGQHAHGQQHEGRDVELGDGEAAGHGYGHHHGQHRPRNHRCVYTLYLSACCYSG